MDELVAAGGTISRPEPAARGQAADSPFRVTDFGDIKPEQHKDWIVEDVLAAGELTVWYGFPGDGKSGLVGDAAAHVAAGLPWFGKPVQQRAVLIVAAERPALVRRRLRAWAKENKIEDRLPLAVVEGAVDLVSSPAHADEIIRIGRAVEVRYKIKVGLVIIDPKAQVMGGGDPDRDKDINALAANVRRIQAGLDGAHVALVDHVPYGAPERMKGSGALPAAADGSFLIRKESKGTTRTMVIGSKAFNDGPEEFAIAFTLKSVEVGNDKGKVTTAPIVVPAAKPTTAHQRRSRSRTEQKIMAAYGRLVDEQKTYPAPPVPGVRLGTRAVTLADLREVATSLGIFSKPKPAADADQKEQDKWRNGRDHAFTRGLEAATDPFGGELRLENEFVWAPYAAVSAFVDE